MIVINAFKVKHGKYMNIWGTQQETAEKEYHCGMEGCKNRQPAHHYHHQMAENMLGVFLHYTCAWNYIFESCAKQAMKILNEIKKRRDSLQA